jgi:UDP-N-acetylglucosamine acyltransferase
VSIHPTAVVDRAAEFGDGVEIGPCAVIGAGVRLGPRCRVGPHACLQGPLEMGEECVVGFSAALGHDPQVKGKSGPFGRTRIGARNVFREFSQVHRSMLPEGETVVGDDNYFMSGAHAAHDCRVGNHVVLCNNVMLSGHVEIGDRAFLSGACGIHQFARVGTLAMVAGLTGSPLDVPPYSIVAGSRPILLRGLNTVGLRRAGVASEARLALREAFRRLFRSDLPVPERLASIDPRVPEVARLLEFVRSTKRGVVGLSRAYDDGDDE